MPKRITVTYRCDHGGERLPDVVQKYWDTAPGTDRYCFCMRDDEKGKPKATLMKILSVDVVDSQPE